MLVFLNSTTGPSPRCAYADEDLDELRRGKGEERHPGLPAAAWARSVVPVPGAADKLAPLAVLTPSELHLVFEENKDLLELDLGIIGACGVLEPGHFMKLAFELSKSMGLLSPCPSRWPT
jgi:hypothetical protein